MVLHIKDFPDTLHRQLKVRAAERGLPIYQLIISMLAEEIDRKRMEEKEGEK
jgi:plasmid stability protein